MLNKLFNIKTNKPGFGQVIILHSGGLPLYIPLEAQTSFERPISSKPTSHTYVTVVMYDSEPNLS